jgi:hypothetical protein
LVETTDEVAQALVADDLELGRFRTIGEPEGTG